MTSINTAVNATAMLARTLNSDLLDPGQDPSDRKVPSVVAHTEPFPLVELPETRYYYCSVSTASFIREDGKKLAFVHGIFETNQKHDIIYMEREISQKCAYLRLATLEEIRSHKMRMNPTKTIKDELLADPEVRKELEDQIRQELLAGGLGNAGNGEQTLKEVVKGDNFRASIVSSNDIAGATQAGPTATMSAIEKLQSLKAKK